MRLAEAAVTAELPNLAMDGQLLAMVMMRVILMTTERAAVTIMSPFMASVPRMERAMVMTMRDAGCEISPPGSMVAIIVVPSVAPDAPGVRRIAAVYRMARVRVVAMVRVARTGGRHRCK
jgi:hypothetical protein